MTKLPNGPVQGFANDLSKQILIDILALFYVKYNITPLIALKLN